MRTIDLIVVHHTAGPATQTVEQIRRYHVEERGFADIGYHYLIDSVGRLHVGRPINPRPAVSGGS